MVSLACLGQILAGCGIGQEDTPERLDFALPSCKFVVSSTSPQWRQSPPGGTPEMVCAGPQALATNCCLPPAPSPAIDCEQYPVACDPASNLCALTFDVEDIVAVDLVADVEEVAEVEGRVFSQVTLSSLTATMTGGSQLSIRTADLFLAPAGVGGSSSPGVELLAHLPLAAGANVIEPSAAARQAFAGFARNYHTPFSLLLSAHVVVPRGTVPSGSATITVTGQVEAYY
jgi:hypothetical protein